MTYIKHILNPYLEYITGEQTNIGIVDEDISELSYCKQNKHHYNTESGKGFTRSELTLYCVYTVLNEHTCMTSYIIHINVEFSSYAVEPSNLDLTPQ